MLKPVIKPASVVIAVALAVTAIATPAAAEKPGTEDALNFVWTADPSVVRRGMTAAEATAAAVAPAPATWAGCGVYADPLKIVRTFPRSKVLRCGNTNYGYWHIYARHRSQGEAKAAGTYQNWRDIADIGMYAALSNSTVTKIRYSNDTTCFSKRIYLVDVRTGRTVGRTITRIVAGNRSNNVVTSFPSSGYCTGTE
jgi:hypothetical protein